MANAAKKGEEKNSVLKKLVGNNLTWSVVALIALIILCTIFDHQFLKLSWNTNTGGLSGPLITMLQESARYLMIATGMTLVISTAGIDLSVGSVMAVAGAVAMQTLASGTNVWLSILLALVVGLALGCVNGALVSILGLQPFITTLIMMLAGRGLTKVITSGENTDASRVAGGEPQKPPPPPRPPGGSRCAGWPTASCSACPSTSSSRWCSWCWSACCAARPPWA